MIVCWARLILKGKDHGIHAFLFHLRDEKGILPNITIKDCGHKMGINGVDNARFWFHNLRVPKAALLNRFGDISDDGEYSSPLKDPSARFAQNMGIPPSRLLLKNAGLFLSLFSTVSLPNTGMLSDGRLHISRQSTQASKLGLTTAIRYSLTRTQFGPPGEPEVPIMSYQIHQVWAIFLSVLCYVSERLD